MVSKQSSLHSLNGDVRRLEDITKLGMYINACTMLSRIYERQNQSWKQIKLKRILNEQSGNKGFLSINGNNQKNNY